MAATRATISLYLDRSSNPSGGVCGIYIRVSFAGKRRFYSLPKKFELSEGRVKMGLTPDDFEKATGSKPRGDFKVIYNILNTYKSRAVAISDKLDTRFSWGEFEKEYLGNQRAKCFLKAAFEDYAQQLRTEGRISTAVSHECACASFEKFRPGTEFASVTVKFLKDYEGWMHKDGNSPTTIGIYCRNLRTVMKKYATFTPEAYPFGLQQHGKFEIPTSVNHKKALTTEQIKAIRDYNLVAGTPQDKARDYWLLIYYCNGMNIKDIALLKHADIDGDTLSFIRAKTSRTKKKQTPITVKLNDRAKAIIAKWAMPPGSSPFLFPILSDGLTPAQQYDRIGDFRGFVNENMKEIGNKLGIPRLTSYVGRHSFATTLKNKGFEVAYISESLGHSSVLTTQRYLNSFGSDKKHAAAAALDEL